MKQRCKDREPHKGTPTSFGWTASPKKPSYLGAIDKEALLTLIHLFVAGTTDKALPKPESEVLKLGYIFRYQSVTNVRILPLKMNTSVVFLK